MSWYKSSGEMSSLHKLYNGRMDYTMSKKEARKVTIIEELLSQRFTNKQAADLLAISVRQVQRLKARASTDGVMNLLHKNRGRIPANALNSQVAANIVQTYQTELAGYNFCHATDILAEDKGIYVSVSTLSRHLKVQGIRSPKAKRRPKKHRSRDARQQEGEMVQMDASKFDWLSNGSYLHLHGAIDDATGKILALHFTKEETFEGYCELMFQMNHDGHLPKELYTDGRTVFVYDSKIKHKLTIAEELQGMVEKQPHFARAVKELNILLIIARSAQAKGGIERLWETLQDRLTKDMKRKLINTVESANAFLQQYIPYFNRKFAVEAANPTKAYLPKQDPAQIQMIFSKHETRKLDKGLTFSYKGEKYRLPLYVGHLRLPVSPHEVITVATSKHIGIQVLYKGIPVTPEPINQQPHMATTLPSGTIDAPDAVIVPKAKTKNTSPWFDYTTMFYSKRKGDISPEQLTP